MTKNLMIDFYPNILLKQMESHLRLILVIICLSIIPVFFVTYLLVLFEKRRQSVQMPIERSGHGDLYGVRYIHQYEEELTKIFEIGVRNSANKMSAGKIRENLMKKYPGRF